MSSSSSFVDVKNKHENEFLEFLLKRLKNAGGSLQLNKISGHLSQLSFDVRSAVGTSKSDLLCFIKKHSTVLNIDGDVVKIVDSKNEGYDSDNSSIEPSQSQLPSNIKKGKGVVIKLFPGYGFIKAKEPIKTAVYFNSFSFGNKDIDLTSSLYIGAMVYFDAKNKKDDSRSKYFAVKVWKVDETDIQNNIVFKKSRKNRDSGLYDPMTLDSEGVIQTVFPNLGFIAVKGDESNTVFFHKNRLSKYDNVVDLTKVLSKGDIVEFSAHRSTKTDAKARWEATKVWKKSNQSKETCDSKSDKSLGSHSSISKIDVKSKHNTKEMIKNQRGKICPRSQGAVIKFGQNELADGDASLYYISGCHVTDISWEFSEGDSVFFDAVKIKSAPGWKAVLVWVGEKPDIVLPTCLGDFSEFTDDETEDNLSSYVSYSSNSSAKSDGSSFKNRKMKKETSSSVSTFSGNKKDTNISKEQLNCSHSQYSSQSSLNSYVTSKSSKRSNSNHNDDDYDKFSSSKNIALSNWGDSPCPADNDNPISSDNYDYTLLVKSKHNKVPKVQIKEIQSMEHLDSSIEVKTGNIENEFCSLEEINEDKDLISEPKKTSYVKKFKCIKGKIIKLYSKFAEVKEKGVENIFSFFWNNFYINGFSVEDLELDDLKQVLKIGDVICFNYFEIVDDSGQKWHKVSLAWKDSKPKNVTEITPEDFIKQNNLCVSNKIATDNTEENNAVSKKYLIAVTDLDPDKVVDTSSESSAEDESLISADQPEVSKLPNKIFSSLDHQMMASLIIKILKKSCYFSDSEVNFNSIAEEIINIVLNNHDPRKCDNKFCQSSQTDNINMASNIVCAVCGEDIVLNTDKFLNSKKSEVQKYRDDFVLNSDNGVSITNSEVQTIITGEIIAQNIFTEC